MQGARSGVVRGVVVAVVASAVLVVLLGVYVGREVATRSIADRLAAMDRRDAEDEGSAHSGEEWSALEARLTRIESSFDALGEKLAALQAEGEARARTPPGGAGAEGAGGEIEPATFSAGTNDSSRGTSGRNVSATELEDFRTLLERFFDEGFGANVAIEDQQRFWALARSTDALDRVMEDLESDVDADPRDTAPRMELAQAYVAKLLTVPGGPERGVWSSKAESQWREVVNLDPNHWEAHASLGINYSYYPTFLNKTQEAIDWLEKSRTLLANEPVDDDHVQNFTLLSQLYQRQGDRARAREVLEAGLARHPGDESIRSALAEQPPEASDRAPGADE